LGVCANCMTFALVSLASFKPTRKATYYVVLLVKTKDSLKDTSMIRPSSFSSMMQTPLSLNLSTKMIHLLKFSFLGDEVI